MGSYLHGHLGVYIEFPKDLKKEVKKQKLVSPATGKEFKVGKANFCPESGQELEVVDYVKTVDLELQAYDVPEHLDEGMFTGAGHRNVIIPNFFDEAIEVQVDFDKGDSSFDLTDFDTKSAIEFFKEEYKDYIDHYTNKYGPCEIKFGLVVYWW